MLAVQEFVTFPSIDSIFSYVSKHPDTCEEKFPQITRRVVGSVAYFFAGRRQTIAEVEAGVELVMKTNIKKQLSNVEFALIKSFLEKVLIDCAKNKPLPLKEEKILI